MNSETFVFVCFNVLMACMLVIGFALLRRPDLPTSSNRRFYFVNPERASALFFICAGGLWFLFAGIALLYELLT